MAKTGSWNNWIRTHGPKLMLYSRQQTRSEADAEDVMQKALVKTWKTVGNKPKDKILGLVYTNVRRCAIDLGRSHDRRVRREEFFVAESGDPVSWFEMPEDDESRALQVALASIPEKYREVITLKIWGDLTFDEIGRTLVISPNTAASRYRYGIGSLRTRLAREAEYLVN